MKPGTPMLLLCGLFVAVDTVSAQSISFNPFYSAPLMLTPAFAGMFDGKLRANVLYRREWRSITVPDVGMAASVDMSIHSCKNSYWAVGGQVFRGQAGDGNLTNFYGLASVAFHQRLRHGIRLGLGAQLGYIQKSVDLSHLYFSQLSTSIWMPAPSPAYPIGWGNAVTTYAINTGASFYHDVSTHFNYTVAASFNNINQPTDAIEKKHNSEVGNEMHINAVVAANWQVSNRIGIRPSVLYQISEDRQYLLGGSEFHFGYEADKAKKTMTNTVFAGAWYRAGDVTTFTAGTEIGRFRAYLGYDYHLSTLNQTSEGNGGFEVAARYVVPRKK